MKIIVTGATGFIGQNLIKQLLNNGHEIVTIVRAASDISTIDNRAEIFNYDGDIENIIEYFQKEHFDGVIHLASLFLATHQPKEIASLIHSNIQFGTEILEASKASDVKWFINTGTFWQHYDNQEYNPVNLYAASKEAFEKIAKFYTQTSDLVFTTIKLNDTFGPHDTRAKVFNLWTKIAASQEKLGMSAGEQIIDISYIDDVVNAYMRLVALLDEERMPHNGQTYVVSNSERMSLKALSKVYEKVTGTVLNIEWGQRAYREREVMSPYDSGKAVPGWKQQYTLEEAIVKTVKEINND